MSDPGAPPPPDPAPGGPGSYGGPPPPGQPAGYGWGSSPYGTAYPTADHPQGTTVLVLGILSLVVCGILGPVAWVMGSKAIKEIDAYPGYYRNRGSVQAGRIMGMVATGLIVASILLAVVFIVAIAASEPS